MPPTNRQRPPFRAEHLGSLPRPAALLEKRDAVEEGKATQQELTVEEDKGINELIRYQIDCGFHAVSDGELRRATFWGDFFDRLEGFEYVPVKSNDVFRQYVPDVIAFTDDGKRVPESLLFCTGKIKHVGSSYVDAFNYLKSKLPESHKHAAKLSLASPSWFHLRYRQPYPKSIYPSDKEYFADVAKAYRVELDICYKNGVRNVQIDDPNLAYLCSEKVIEGFKNDGESTEALLDSYIEFYNDCLSSRPKDLHVGIHICRGNFPGGRYFSEGGYDTIARKLFQRLNVDTFYLEYDSPRAGGFEPLKYLPRNKNVVLGLISSKSAQLEDIDELKKKVYAAADLISEGNGLSRDKVLNQISVSPQCGFASGAKAYPLSREVMTAKLQLVRKLADELWPGQP